MKKLYYRLRYFVLRDGKDLYCYVTRHTTLHLRRDHWHPLSVRQGKRPVQHRLGGHLCRW